MKWLHKKSLWKRALAVLLVAMMIVDLLPAKSMQVKAAPGDPSTGTITVKVIDGSGSAIKDALVKYSITKRDPGVSFEDVIDQEVNTDNTGIASIEHAIDASYFDGTSIEISGTVSMPGYDPVTMPVTPLSSVNQNLGDVDLGERTKILLHVYKPDGITSISGATVSYTIDKTDAGIEFPKVEASSATTDGNGILQIGRFDAGHLGKIAITATINADGFKTFTLTDQMITSNDQDITVTLEANSEFSAIEVTPITGLVYNGAPQALISGVVAKDGAEAVEGVTVEYSLDGGSTYSTDVPESTDSGDHTVTVKVSKTGYNSLTKAETVTIGKATITGINIANADLTYDGLAHELVTLNGSFEPGDVVKWYLGTDITASIPTGTAAGSYDDVTLMIERENYNPLTLTCSGIIIKNAAIDLGELTVTGNKLTYNEEEQELVTVSNKGDYTLKYQLGDGSLSPDAALAKWSDDIPKEKNAGNYVVWVKAVKENYKDQTVDVSKPEDVELPVPYNAVIQKQELVLDNLGITIRENVKYNGSFQEIFDVEVLNGAPFSVTYQKANASGGYNEQGTWTTVKPTYKNAGEYVIWLKVEHSTDAANYKTYYEKVTAEVHHAELELSFDKLSMNKNEMRFTKAQLAVSDGQEIDISASITVPTVDTLSITYEIVEEDEEGNPVSDSDMANIANSSIGKLRVTGPGSVTVKASVAEPNYEKKAIVSTIIIMLDDSEEQHYVNFTNSTIKYVINTKTGIPTNKATNGDGRDKGEFEYSLNVDSSECGLSIVPTEEAADVLGGAAAGVSAGDIKISDYAKLIAAVESNNNDFKVEVNIKKAEMKNLSNSTRYSEWSGSYDLQISLADVPTGDLYKLYDPDHQELLEPNGVNGWFTTKITVVPADSNYQVIRANAVKTALSFSGSVCLGEDAGGTAEDQGTFSHAIYLQEKATGKITKKIELKINNQDIKLDTVKPNDIEISYSNITEKEGIKYGKDSVKITFVAYDQTSGVDSFTWEYCRDDDASLSNIEKYENLTIAAVQDANDNTKYTASVILPKETNEQLKGKLSVKATDIAGNVSDEYKDSGVFVVDSIPPLSEVSYELVDKENGKIRTVDSKHYFSNDVIFTFKMTEANFFATDVAVTYTKNGDVITPSLTWLRDGVSDDYFATLEFSEEAEYTVMMMYTDRSGNEMVAFQSDVIIIDKTKPVVSFEYKDYTDADTPQTAIITIVEHNFRANDINLGVVASDINGNMVDSGDLQEYLRNYHWVSEGDVHRAVISGKFADAIYKLTFNYSDLAWNPADELVTDEFIIDHTAPAVENMNISYSVSTMDKILSALTFGYYKYDVTVAFTAYDSVSGIDYFVWNYQKQTGASTGNVESYNDSVLSVVQDSDDKSKFTAAITLPMETAAQLRGSLAFIATDKCGNSSNKMTDDAHVIVVDSIAPTMQVEFSSADNLFGSKDYYKKTLVVTFTVTEANFYDEDVNIKLRKDNGADVEIKPVWREESTDVHIGTYSIEALENHSNDGEYVFTVEYADRSGNEMTRYTSGVKVVDTTRPVIHVDYSEKNPVNTIVDHEGNTRKYFAKENIATISVIERNFDANAVNFTIQAKDVAGNELNASSLYTRSAWTHEGDMHTMTITYPGDANYTFDVEYTDLARIAAADYAADYFTVDTTKPTNLTISYSTSILEAVLSGITFGFYNAKVDVTISATDDISSVHLFKYSYINAADVSDVNAELKNVVIPSEDITYSNGGAVGTASFVIPRDALAANNQFNGTVNFTADDRAENEADYLRDERRIVIDNITPTSTVEYNRPVRQENNISYYDGDISVTVTIHEANFYEEDVNITVTKDGTATAVSATWRSENSNIHVGTFVITGDGDYFISITYTDKSNNAMQNYLSAQMTIDTDITEAAIVINGEDGNGKAFKNDVIPMISFSDRNYDSYTVKLLRTNLAQKNVDVTEKFIGSNIMATTNGGSGTIDTFERLADNDGIYTLIVGMTDKANHSIEKTVTFTVNRFGSVYSYSDYLISMIKDGGAYVQSVDQDFVITEYNADRLLSDSLEIAISKDGKPIENGKYEVAPEINDNVAIGESGWYQYAYTISKDNFVEDGVYKISISSKDATGNRPENSNYDDMGISFRVDSTVPEITSITGLEKSVVNATENTVRYSVYDTIALKSVAVYVDDNEVDQITDFSEDGNNYSGSFTIRESTNAQHVRIVVTDMAGNMTDTDADNFSSSYEFNSDVTVSTNLLVRWYANKPLFYGTIGGGVVTVAGGGTGATLFIRKRRLRNLVKK